MEGFKLIKATIVGGSGYTGGEVIRILLSHPEVRIAHVISRTHAGKQVSDVFPNLRGLVDLEFCPLEISEYINDTDVVFCCAPHGTAMDLASGLGDAKMIDLGPDFRFRDPATFEAWYKISHAAPELLKNSAYGLVELHKEAISRAKIIGNPGCYPTCSILALAPLLSHGLIDPASIVIDAKSGVSGAGRTPGPGYHFPEINDGMRPYGVPGHRHTPEIEQELSSIAGVNIVCSFTPHLVPMTRGILVTCYAKLNEYDATGYSRQAMDSDDMIALYQDFYHGKPFVRVLGKDMLPNTKAVYGSNFCDVTVRVDTRTKRVIAMAAIDNLVKGAAGQAVQNMNVMFGLDERVGLLLPPIFP